MRGRACRGRRGGTLYSSNPAALTHLHRRSSHPATPQRLRSNQEQSHAGKSETHAPQGDEGSALEETRHPPPRLRPHRRNQNTRGTGPDQPNNAAPQEAHAVRRMSGFRPQAKRKGEAWRSKQAKSQAGESKTRPAPVRDEHTLGAEDPVLKRHAGEAKSAQRWSVRSTHRGGLGARPPEDTRNAKGSRSPRARASHAWAQLRPFQGQIARSDASWIWPRPGQPISRTIAPWP